MRQIFACTNRLIGRRWKLNVMKCLNTFPMKRVFSFNLASLGNGFIVVRQSCQNVGRKKTLPTYRTVEQLTPFTGKTLFLAGEESNYVTAQDISILFPEATLSVIANAGHWLHVQQPGVFIEQVEEFLCELEMLD